MNDPVLALHRFGLGAKPGQLGTLPDDIRSKLKNDLRSGRTLLQAEGLRSTSANLAAWSRFKVDGRRRMSGEMAERGASVAKPVPPRQQAYLDEIGARLVRFREAETGMLERLTLFWTNHFAISIRKGMARAMAGSYEREAIRPHVTGRFADLLKAVVAHPAMLFYLDNNRSIGPGSKQGRRRNGGLNENLARELLELHTLGVDGGYDQADVTETARILTGWSFRGGKATKEPFTAAFFRAQHEPGPKTVLGKRYSEAGEEEAVALLDDLARHPATARHIATKLARHFVADAPSDELIDALEASFLDGDGDLLHVYDTLLDHPAAWSPVFGKLRTPQEWLVAAVRAFDVDLPPLFADRSLRVMGHRFWSPRSPEGYEDDAEAWLGGASIKARLDWAAAYVNRFSPDEEPLVLADKVLGTRLSDETKLTMRRAATRNQALQIMLLAPEMMRR